MAGIVEFMLKVTVFASFEIAPPEHVVVAVLGVIVTPAGSVSPKSAFNVATEGFALLKVIVSVELPPALIMSGLKAFPIVGGIGMIGGRHVEAVTTLESRVTAPFRARALPNKLALVLRVMLVRARILPRKVVVVPSVAELPICQKTLQA